MAYLSKLKMSTKGDSAHVWNLWMIVINPEVMHVLIECGKSIILLNIKLLGN